MNRSTLRSLSIAFAAGLVSLSPVAANAQTPPIAGARWGQDLPSSGLTVNQVRAEFVQQGFQVEPPINWWTSNHVTTFRVFDHSGQDANQQRVLMVLVYPDTASAEAERLTAQTREQSSTVATAHAPNADSGPHLVLGYGLSAWRQNVAFVESTTRELSRQYAAELDRDNQGILATAATTEAPDVQPIYAVDLDFLAVVDQGFANM